MIRGGAGNLLGRQSSGQAVFWACNLLRRLYFFRFLHCKVVFCTTLSYNLELVLYLEKLYFEMLYFETGRILI